MGPEINQLTIFPAQCAWGIVRDDDLRPPHGTKIKIDFFIDKSKKCIGFIKKSTKF